ncbi:MAG: hypothetical protein GXO75_07490, partial [Calditrichaeota bacterium]|nr:hypothetical protein [Calditrichota bacterium]
MKRFFKAAVVVLLLLAATGCQNKNQTQDAAEGAGVEQTPAWLRDRPIVFVGNWDAAPIIMRRWGKASTDYDEIYRRMHTEETVKKMKEQGITLVITHFHKGFGLEAERPYIEDTAKFTALCHKYGIKVGVYIGDTICYETFLSERPDAADWLVPDYLGEPVRYGGTQTFRRRPYIGHLDYVDYLKKLIRVAVQEVKADLIHFDNSCSQALPENFHHPLAVEQFRAFLQNKYDAAQLEQRFGFADMRHIVPPKYRGTPQPMWDPLFQEWTDFRCQKLGDHYRDMRAYIKSLNPDVVVEHNPHGVTGHNTAWLRGVDWPRTIASTRAFWSESEKPPGLRDDGVLVSKIRTYKIARIMDNICFTVTGSDELRMAEAMAFNQNCLGYMGGVLSVYNMPETRGRYIRFFTDHFRHYRDADTIADVAILRTFATMAYSSYRTQYSAILFEQTLIQERIPFDIIFDHNLKDLSKYSVLVLANQECLSDEQLEQMRAFVRDGGGLVMTENTSLYTEWMRRRPQLGLGDLFDAGLATAKKRIQGKYGKGRVVYLPAIVPAIVLPKKTATTSEYWKAPVNAGELVDAVKWA